MSQKVPQRVAIPRLVIVNEPVKPLNRQVVSSGGSIYHLDGHFVFLAGLFFHRLFPIGSPVLSFYSVNKMMTYPF